MIYSAQILEWLQSKRLVALNSNENLEQHEASFKDGGNAKI